MYRTQPFAFRFVVRDVVWLSRPEPTESFAAFSPNTGSDISFVDKPPH